MLVWVSSVGKFQSRFMSKHPRTMMELSPLGTTSILSSGPIRFCTDRSVKHNDNFKIQIIKMKEFNLRKILLSLTKIWHWSTKPLIYQEIQEKQDPIDSQTPMELWAGQEELKETVELWLIIMMILKSTKAVEFLLLNLLTGKSRFLWK